jgi:hypothetical protein
LNDAPNTTWIAGVEVTRLKSGADQFLCPEHGQPVNASLKADGWHTYAPCCKGSLEALQPILDAIRAGRSNGNGKPAQTSASEPALSNGHQNGDGAQANSHPTNGTSPHPDSNDPQNALLVWKAKLFDAAESLLRKDVDQSVGGRSALRCAAQGAEASDRAGFGQRATSSPDRDRGSKRSKTSRGWRWTRNAIDANRTEQPTALPNGRIRKR